jgi:hypothetical protein
VEPSGRSTDGGLPEVTLTTSIAVERLRARCPLPDRPVHRGSAAVYWLGGDCESVAIQVRESRSARLDPIGKETHLDVVQDLPVSDFVPSTNTLRSRWLRAPPPHLSTQTNFAWQGWPALGASC